MSDVILREKLLASFQALEQQFNTSLAEATELDNQFEQLHKQFCINMDHHLQPTHIKLPKNHPMSAQISGFLAAITATDKAWNDKLRSRDKGIKFRKNFNDSLLVFIYGKVKSGKSSLGNYMAWGNTDPDPKLKASPSKPHPRYFSHENTLAANGDTQDEAMARKEFRVGATEATSSIQGFSLPGLTWVDSPGLHSVNEENGLLAKEYAEHADLILYTMRSDAPGRASDMAEIRLLKAQGKETLILITGSDFNEEDWDDTIGDIISIVKMKDQQTRREQREVIAKELGYLISNEILSVSARYAQEHADSEVGMADSGMVQLFHTLHRISQEEGVRVKRNVPLRNFQLFMQGCIDELEPYNKLIADLDGKVKNLQTSVPKIMTRKVREAQSIIRQEIDTTFDELAKLRNNEHQMNEALRKARHHWNSSMQTAIGDALTDGLADVLTEFKDATTRTWHTSTLSLPNFSVEKVTEQIPDGVKKSTRNRNSGIGGLVGGAIGFVFGGPAGAAIGSGIGGAIGAATGDSAEPNMRTIEIQIGDNLEDIRSQTLMGYCDEIEKTVKEQGDNLLKQQLIELKQITLSLKNELQSVSEAFTQLKLAAEQKIKI